MVSGAGRERKHDKIPDKSCEASLACPSSQLMHTYTHRGALTSAPGCSSREKVNQTLRRLENQFVWAFSKASNGNSFSASQLISIM